MSYDVVIVAVPMPANDAEAWRAIERLQDADTGPASEVFQELHRRLTARFPCICDDDSGPWSYGPLIDGFGTVIATVGIVGSRIDEVLPFVVETATDLTLVVFDHQAGEVHRPSNARSRVL